MPTYTSQWFQRAISGRRSSHVFRAFFTAVQKRLLLRRIENWSTSRDLRAELYQLTYFFVVFGCRSILDITNLITRQLLLTAFNEC